MRCIIYALLHNYGFISALNVQRCPCRSMIGGDCEDIQCSSDWTNWKHISWSSIKCYCRKCGEERLW